MQTKLITLDGLDVEVQVLERKFRFGWHLALITPVSGKGEKWVREEKLKEEGIYLSSEATKNSPISGNRI